MKAQGIKLGYDFEGNLTITVKIPHPDPNEVERLQKLSEAEVEVEIRRRRERRSLDANALLWKLLQGIAEKLSSSAEEIYLHMLERYGWYDFIVVRPEAVQAAKRLFRIAKERSVLYINGKKGVQLQVWPGSSRYDAEQMSHLIEGVISECREIGCWYPDEEAVGHSISLWRRHEEHSSK